MAPQLCDSCEWNHEDDRSLPNNVVAVFRAKVDGSNQCAAGTATNAPHEAVLSETKQLKLHVDEKERDKEDEERRQERRREVEEREAWNRRVQEMNRGTDQFREYCRRKNLFGTQRSVRENSANSWQVFGRGLDALVG